MARSPLSPRRTEGRGPRGADLVPEHNKRSANGKWFHSDRYVWRGRLRLWRRAPGAAGGHVLDPAFDNLALARGGDFADAEDHLDSDAVDQGYQLLGGELGVEGGGGGAL